MCIRDRPSTPTTSSSSCDPVCRALVPRPAWQINAAAEVIYANVDPNANIIFGALVDGSMGDNMAVTVIATGFGAGRK